MLRSFVFEWHKRFKEGLKDVEDNSRSGKPSTCRTDYNVERVRRMIVSELDINHDGIWKTITENLGMWKICANMMPKAADQKERRMHMSDILEHLGTEIDLLEGVNYWWWVMDLRVWPGNQASEPSMEETGVAEVEESRTNWSPKLKPCWTSIKLFFWKYS